MGKGSEDLRFRPGSVTDLLCDLRQDPFPLWALVSPCAWFDYFWEQHPIIYASQCHSKKNFSGQWSLILLYKAGLFWSNWNMQSLDCPGKVVKSWIYLLMKWLLVKTSPCSNSPPLFSQASLPLHPSVSLPARGWLCPANARPNVLQMKLQTLQKMPMEWPWWKWVGERLDSHMKPLTNEDGGGGPLSRY